MTAAGADHGGASPDLDLTPMTKIEVVVDGADEHAVRDVFLGAGASGYTAVTGVSGFGHHGEHQGRLLFNDRSSLSMLITVVPDDRVAAVVAGVRRILEDRRGVFFVTPTAVSRPDYFGAEGSVRP
jgi:nitrogen regulatory protein PII